MEFSFGVSLVVALLLVESQSERDEAAAVDLGLPVDGAARECEDYGEIFPS